MTDAQLVCLLGAAPALALAVLYGLGLFAFDWLTTKEHGQ